MQLHDIEHFQRCISCGKQSRDNRKIFGNIIGNTESCQGTACHQKLFTDLHNFDQFRWIGIKIDHIARFLSRLCTAVHCNAHICLSQCRRIVRNYVHQFALLFLDLQKKCDSAEISTKALDLRGMLDALRLIRRGVPAGAALDMGITNKAFDSYEQGLIRDVIAARIPAQLTAVKLFR